MQKKQILFFILVLICVEVSIGSSYAQGNSTTSTTLTLMAGQLMTNQLALNGIKTSESYGFSITEEYNNYFRFWIMNSTEYGKWQVNSTYQPICLINISAYVYLNTTFRFPSDGNYVYGIKNEGTYSIIVTIEITRPSSINGFEAFWIIIGLLFLVGIIYLQRYKSKTNSNQMLLKSINT